MAEVKITNKNFNELITSGKTIMLDFYADWCGPCKMIAPIVAEIAQERLDLEVGKINIDEQMELAQTFQVISIPTIIIIKDQKAVKRSVGLMRKEQLLAMLS